MTTSYKTQRALRRKLRAAARRVPFRGPPALYLTDQSRTPDPVATAGALPCGWGVVYRHFGAEDRADTARRLARICRRRGLVLLIAADPALARRVGASGVHWPEARLDQAGRRGAFTAAAHSRAALVRAAKAGAAAALFSTVFASDSPSAGRPLGAIRFRLLARRAPLPLYALGGVDARTAGRVSHVSGFAAIGGLEAAFGPVRRRTRTA